MDSESVAQTVEDAKHAQAILENPVFNKVFDELRIDIYRDWTASNAYDKEGREELFKFFKLLEGIKARFIKKINEASIVEAFSTPDEVI